MSEVTNEKLALMYEMARSAKASNDATTAKKYYDMILADDPLNWEPMFYSVYFTYATMKNGEIGNKTCEIKNCLKTVLLVVEKKEDEAEKNKILLELKDSISTVATILHAASICFYNSLPGLAKNPFDKSKGCLMFVWCPGPDSNRYTSRRQHLKLMRLPISPPGPTNCLFVVKKRTL